MQEKGEGIPTRFRDFHFSCPRATSPKALRYPRWIGATRGKVKRKIAEGGDCFEWCHPLVWTRIPFLSEIPRLKQGCGLLWQTWGLKQSHLAGKDLKVHQAQPLIMSIFCLFSSALPYPPEQSHVWSECLSYQDDPVWVGSLDLASSNQACRSNQEAEVHFWVMFTLACDSAGQNVLQASHPSPKSTEPLLRLASLFLSVVHSMSVFPYQCIRLEYLI